MRVIHISPTIFGRDGLFGGGERYPVELTRALSRHVDCKLVSFGARASRHRDGGVDVVVLEPASLLRGHPAHPVPRGLLREIDGADVIHAHHLRALPSRMAAISAFLRHQHRVVTDHGLGAARGPSLVPRIFERFLTVSRYSAATLKIPGAKARVIYGGADTQRFRPDPAVRREGVLFVGRVTPHKGLDRLIEALPAGARLTVAGTVGHDPRPPERDYPALLQRLAATRNVRFVSGISDDELPDLYASARVVVLPSVYETCYGKRVEISELLGLSLLEAAASGTPVIASAVGGVPEVVVHGETGFLVEPGDVGELRTRLEEVLGDDALATRLGTTARDHILERFTWEHCAQRCLSAYEELMLAA